MRNRNRLLWGQQIDIVEGGLDEEQVTLFVSELMSKYRVLVERQEHLLSLGALSEKAAMEGDKLVTEMKDRARREAEAEASVTISRANQRSQDMIATAKKTAQEVTRRESENILDGAHRKAHTIETEARQRAQLFVMRARAVIENDLKKEFIEVYDQLLSSLRDSLAEEHDVEARWKGKIVELWRKESLQLEGYEAVPSILAAEIARVSSLSEVKSEAKIEISREELRIKEEEVFLEASLNRSIPYEAPPVSPITGATEALAPDGESLQEAAEAAAEEIPLEVAAEKPTEKAVTEEPPKEEIRVEPEAPKVELPPALMGELNGEVDISLVPPVELSVMSKIFADLQGNSEIRILRTLGSYDKGTTVTILLESPVRLVDMLTQIPGVEIAPLSEAKKQSFLKKGARPTEAGKITIPLRTLK